jgi:hypothetical protein
MVLDGGEWSPFGALYAWRILSGTPTVPDSQSGSGEVKNILPLRGSNPESLFLQHVTWRITLKQIIQKVSSHLLTLVLRSRFFYPEDGGDTVW